MIEFIEEINENNLIEKDEFLDQDLSGIWTYEDLGTLGFIGSNYRNMKHKFLSIIKDTDVPTTYYAYGKTMVSGVVREFQGALQIQKLYQIKETMESPKDAGIIIGTYKFFENSSLDKTGKFEGRFVSYWTVNDQGQIIYNNLWKVAAGFNNNQFAGTWISYLTSESIQANWGDGRIPLSGDLDVGTSEFYPNSKYKDYGWDDPVMGDKAWWERQ